MVLDCSGLGFLLIARQASATGGRLDAIGVFDYSDEDGTEAAHAGGDRRSRTSARPSGHAGWVPRIPDRAEVRVVRRDSECQFVESGLAHNDCTGHGKALDDRRVAVRYVILEQP